MKNDIYTKWVEFNLHIINNGYTDITEDGEKVITLPNPYVATFDPHEIPSSFPSGLGKKALDTYVEQIISHTNTGFTYTYGNRLQEYFGVNQLDVICDRLQTSTNSRRAIATLYDPSEDHKIANIPCMQYIQVFHTKNTHEMFIMFRSHDILSAWFANMYAISNGIVPYIENKANIHIDRIHCTSVVPHIYYVRDKPALMDLKKEMDYRTLLKLNQLVS